MKKKLLLAIFGLVLIVALYFTVMRPTTEAKEKNEYYCRKQYGNQSKSYQF